MVLYDDNELQEQKERRQKIFFAGVVLLAICGVLIMGYDLVKPLPNTATCEKQGFEAGVIENGLEICYNDCSTNDLNSCDYRGLPK